MIFSYFQLNRQHFPLIIPGKIDKLQAASNCFFKCKPVIAISIDFFTVNKQADCRLPDMHTQRAFFNLPVFRQYSFHNDLIADIYRRKPKIFQRYVIIIHTVNPNIPGIIQ